MYVCSTVFVSNKFKCVRTAVWNSSIADPRFPYDKTLAIPRHAYLPTCLYQEMGPILVRKHLSYLPYLGIIYIINL